MYLSCDQIGLHYNFYHSFTVNLSPLSMRKWQIYFFKWWISCNNSLGCSFFIFCMNKVNSNIAFLYSKIPLVAVAVSLEYWIPVLQAWWHWAWPHQPHYRNCRVSYDVIHVNQKLFKSVSYSLFYIWSWWHWPWLPLSSLTFILWCYPYVPKLVWIGEAVH